MNKQTWQELFDEKFVIENLGGRKVIGKRLTKTSWFVTPSSPKGIKAFIQKQIDKAVSEREKEIDRDLQLWSDDLLKLILKEG